MMKLQRIGLALLACVLLLPMLLVTAQGGDSGETTLTPTVGPTFTPLPTTIPQTDVYITTQDFSSLREGPGQHFDRITVLDPALTLHAIGRTANTGWIQVEYAGGTGWLAAWLLVWSGDIVQLPVDGVNPAAFVRRAGVTGFTTRETPLYNREVVGSDAVGVLPPGTPVEVTGRLGSRGMYRLQILYESQLYWVGSWNIHITGGRSSSAFDTGYLYPYGRLVAQLSRDIDRANQRLITIGNIWRQLEAGEGVICGTGIDYVSRDTTDTDVQQEALFAPAVDAYDAAALHINAAISAFEDACSRAAEGAFLTQAEVTAALEDVESGRRYLMISSSLLFSLAGHNPLLD